MRLLVDTNVFVDCFISRESTNISKSFITFCMKNDIELYATSMSIRDIGYVVSRHYHSKKDGILSQSRTQLMLKKIIDINSDDVINSLYGDNSDFEDSLIMESAERNMMDLIITNNIKHFRNSKIPACTPQTLMDVYQHKEII